MSFLKNSWRAAGGGLIILFILLLSRASATELPAPYFSHLKTENGLSHNKVNCILQDERGFIWMGTEDGLNRYDGKYYVIFNSTPGDTSCLSGNIITHLLEDHNGVLWISTADGGLTSYNYHLQPDKQFRQYKHREGDAHSLPDNNIDKMIADDQDNLWLATANHSLVRFNKRTGVFDTPLKEDMYSVTSMCLDSQDKLWAGTSDGSLLKMDIRTLQYTAEEEQLPAAITGLFDDSRKNIWMGLPDRTLHCYAQGAKWGTIFRNIPGKRDIPEDEITCFAEDKPGNIWMGGKYSGVFVYDRESGRFSHFWQDPLREGSIADNHVNCVYIDRAGIVWIGTNNGVSFYNPLFEPFVQTFLPSSKSDVEIFDFYKDPANNTLWIATSDGLYIKKAGSESFEHKLEGFEGTPLSVSRYFQDTAGISYNVERKLWTRKTARAGNSRLRSDRQPVFTTKQGLKGWEEARKSIPGNDLYDVREDRAGNLWISSYGSGLNFFDTHAKSFSHIKASSNLSEGIQTDDKGNIWMISNGHLHKYSPSTLTYSCYDLPSAKRNGLRGYIYKDNEDNLYAAGMNYYINFRPETVAAINMEPTVWLTDFKIYNHSNSHLLENKVIRLAYDQNYFSIEFSAPEFSGDNLAYSYMLDGVDREWMESDKRNFANYSDLRPGEYTFKVKATNWRGCESNKVSSIRIVIVSPYWRTWWFYLLTMLVIVVISYGVYRYRIREFLKRQAIRNKIALDLHDNIGSTLSSISIYSQVAKVYQDQEEGKQLREVLERIDKTASEAINEMSDMVWAINPRNDDMNSIVARMQSYAQPLCLAKYVTFDFSCDRRIGGLNLEMSQRKNLYFIYKEAINNTLKYSGCTKVEVQLILENYVLRLLIKDNGKGFDINALRDEKPKSLSGNGLYNMERRAAEMKAAFSIISHPEAGTSIELSFRIS